MLKKEKGSGKKIFFYVTGFISKILNMLNVYFEMNNLL